MITINNVVEVSTSLPQKGLSESNPSNILIATREVHKDGDAFGIYINSQAITEEWGSNSLASIAGQSIFSQNQNIRNNSGYVVVASIKGASGSFVAEDATSGNYELTVGSFVETFNFDADIALIKAFFEQVDPNAIVDGNALNFTFELPSLSSVTASVSENTLTDASSDPVIPVLENNNGETMTEFLIRVKQLVEFVGVIETFEISFSDQLALAPFIEEQSNQMIRFTVIDSDSSAIAFAQSVLDQSFSRTRVLFKQQNDKLKFKCSYASRMMSTNFSAFNSTLTPHLKDLVGVEVDNTINQTLLNQLQNLGVDCYPSIQGIPKVFSSGKNWFFDRVHNLLWFINATQIAYFNILAKAKNKIPQTEAGMSVCIAAIKRVCEQGVNNQYIAAGEWTSEDFFGDKEDFLRNIREKGYYVWSQSVALQSPVDRENRIAPVIMIAIKEAGAIHKGNIIISINP